MEVMAMEDNELKEKVRNKIHQKIAIANVRKEFAMKKNNWKKAMYMASSACAVLVLGFGIYVGIGRIQEKSQQSQEIVDLAQGIGNEKETQIIEWKINQTERSTAGNAKIDAKMESIQQEKLPEKSRWLTQAKVPDEYIQKDCYAMYTRNSKEEKEYNILTEYVLTYRKDDTHSIRIAFSDKGEPARDYRIAEKQISKIGKQELVISNYEDLYIVNFQREDIYVDIETVGMTEEQLKEFVISLVNSEKETSQKVVKEGEDNTQEPITTTKSNFPEYYAGRYVDSKGKNVILLCEDTSENRKEICKILGITESKTDFKTATYSYNYLIDLQNKISAKMVKKEFTFVTMSALLEDANKIRVTVTTENETELKKLKALDTKGGALQIEFATGGQIKTELLQEKD